MKILMTSILLLTSTLSFASGEKKLHEILGQLPKAERASIAFGYYGFLGRDLVGGIYCNEVGNVPEDMNRIRFCTQIFNKEAKGISKGNWAKGFSIGEEFLHENGMKFRSYNKRYTPKKTTGADICDLTVGVPSYLPLTSENIFFDIYCD